MNEIICPKCKKKDNIQDVYSYGENEEDAIVVTRCNSCGRTLTDPEYNDESIMNKMIDERFIKYSIMVLITFIFVSYIPTLIVGTYFNKHLIWFLWLSALMMHLIRYILIKKIMNVC